MSKQSSARLQKNRKKTEMITPNKPGTEGSSLQAKNVLTCECRQVEITSEIKSFPIKKNDVNVYSNTGCAEYYWLILDGKQYIFHILKVGFPP